MRTGGLKRPSEFVPFHSESHRSPSFPPSTPDEHPRTVLTAFDFPQRSDRLSSRHCTHRNLVRHAQRPDHFAGRLRAAVSLGNTGTHEILTLSNGCSPSSGSDGEMVCGRYICDRCPLAENALDLQRIKHERRLFYGPSGDAAVAACLNRMGHYYNHAKPITLMPRLSFGHDELFLNSVACVTAGLASAIHAMILTRTLVLDAYPRKSW